MIDYPKSFPPDCGEGVETEKIRADRAFRVNEQNLTLEERALKWVCRVLGAFAHQARGLVISKRWMLTQVGSAVEEFRLELVRHAHFHLLRGHLDWVDRVFGTYIRQDVLEAIEKSDEWQHHLVELAQLADSALNEEPDTGRRDHSLQRWEDLEIRFLSDQRVQIFIRGRAGDTRNFAEMGFQDHRGGGGKPNAAWLVLREFAANNGIVPIERISGQQDTQKRAQEIRKVLCAQFGLTENPVPFVEKTGYVASFRITRSPTCDT